jgi:hypothetical protein
MAFGLPNVFSTLEVNMFQRPRVQSPVQLQFSPLIRPLHITNNFKRLNPLLAVRLEALK